MTKMTTRNVNKILLQAAHSPPHTPFPRVKSKNIQSVCVLKNYRAALWEEAMNMKKFFIVLGCFFFSSMWLTLIITRLETVLRALGWLLI